MREMTTNVNYRVCRVKKRLIKDGEVKDTVPFGL